jgi:hypothetical protein
MLDAMKWIQGLSFATAVRESTWLFPAIETLHVLALVFVIGSISMLDLRLLGVASRPIAVQRLSNEVLPWTWTAFSVALFTGSLLFASKAVTYYRDAPFRLKMMFLLLAGVNMLIFHAGAFRTVRSWNHQLPPPAAARVAGGLSLVFWVGVVVCGRWIGFTT